jgi:hypothetical protein
MHSMTAQQQNPSQIKNKINTKEESIKQNRQKPEYSGLYHGVAELLLVGALARKLVHIVIGRKVAIMRSASSQPVVHDSIDSHGFGDVVHCTNYMVINNRQK